MQEQIQHHRDVLAALRARLQSFQSIKHPSRHKRRRSSVAETVPYSAPNAGPSPTIASRRQPKRYKQPAENVGRGERPEVEERREPRSSTPPPDPQKMPLEGSEAPGIVAVPAGPLLTDRWRGTEEAVPCMANHPSQDVDVKVTRGVRVEQDDYEEGAEAFEGDCSSSNGAALLYDTTKLLKLCPPLRAQSRFRRTCPISPSYKLLRRCRATTFQATTRESFWSTQEHITEAIMMGQVAGGSIYATH